MNRISPFILLFFSGLSALSYQVVWMREFRLVFGASTASTAAVSALFMAGLGLGGWLLGPRVDRHDRPLLFYGRLELGISILAALSPLLLMLTRTLYMKTGGIMVLGLGWGTGARLLLATLVIGLPAFLMGGTLPAAAKAVTMESDRSRLRLGTLYGLNTIGALTGTILTTFLALEALGARDTLTLAVIINFVVACAALKLGQKTPDPAPEAARLDAPEAAAAAEVVRPAAIAPRLALIAAAIAGFTFFLMELVWYRTLGPVLGGSVYTFGLILATALAGIGLGGALHPLVFRNRRPEAWHLAATCLLEALFLMIPYAIGDNLAALAAQLRSMSALGFGGLVGSWTVITFIVVLPTAIVSGIQFPLLISLLGEGRQGLGRQTGLTYAFNTGGAILGSLAGGFGLMPRLGAIGCWILSGALLMGLGLVITLWAWRSLALQRASWRQRGPAFALLSAALFLGGLCFTAEGPTAAWRHAPIGAGRIPVSASINEIRGMMSEARRSIIWEADGVESAVAISVNDGYAFLINGKADGNIVGDRGTQIMVGLIGAALHPNPQRSLVVGLGTGCTAGWLSAVPTMTQVDVVELEPAVLEMARRCASANHDVVKKAENGQGVRIITNDAREVLNTSPDKYDLIVSEPSNPYRAGIASLFTKDFYQEVAGRLNPGGLFLSWCQAYEISTENIISILATLRTVFPYVECWTTQYPSDLVFMASMEPIKPDVDVLAARLGASPYQEAMRIAWDTEGLKAFVGRHLAAPRFIDQMVASMPNLIINTDDLTPLEYAYAQTVGRRTKFSTFDLISAAHTKGLNKPDWAPAAIGAQAVVDGLYPSLLSEPQENNLLPGYNTLDPETKQRVNDLNRWQNGSFSAMLNSWQPDANPPLGLEKLALADALALEGDSEHALALVAQFEDYWPAGAAVIRALLALNLKTDPAEGRGPEAGADHAPDPSQAAPAQPSGSFTDYETAVQELESAFRALRNSPWEIQVIVRQAMDLAANISHEHPQYAERLYRALEEPFALYALEWRRRALLMDVAKVLGDKKIEEVMTRWFEPHPLWNDTFLQMRVSTYAKTGNEAMLAEAIKSYEKFKKADGFNVKDIMLLESMAERDDEKEASGEDSSLNRRR